MGCLNDNDVLALVSGSLGAPERLEVDAHLDGCAACRELVAASAPAPAAVKLGRYRLLEPLSDSPRGEIYAAYDPELDRRVALKLLRAVDASEPAAVARQARLIAEAEALAQLDHPNVIGIDEVGLLEGHVFVAMEFVAGKPLDAWLASGTHEWQEVLRVFIQAGRGLAAMHQGGVVHGDFKPGHVLVGDDGTVRVADFAGLGAARHESGDAHEDQQSFCAALYRALFGERPFLGRKTGAPDGQASRTPAAKTRAPGRVRRLLLREFAVREQDRYPSIDALLDALETDPRSRWRKVGAVALAIGLLMAGPRLFVRWHARHSAEGCLGSAERLHGIWDEEVRVRGAAAFAATQAPDAAEAWTHAAQGLGRYADGWIEMRTDACLATQVRRAQTPELLALRMGCLDERVAGLRAASTLFAIADKTVVARANSVVASLLPLSSCADVDALRAQPAPGADQRIAVAETRARLAQVRALSAAGQPAMPLAQDVRAAAANLGYPPLEAEALFELAQAQRSAGELADAEHTFELSAGSALAAKSDALLLDSWLAILALDLEEPDLDAADRAAAQATAAASRLPGQPRAQGALLLGLGKLAFARGKIEEAQQQTEAAAALLASDPASAQRLVDAISVQADAVAQLGRWEQAVTIAERALRISQDAYGPAHPASGQLEESLGSLLTQRGQLAEAEPHLERALSILEAAQGSGSVALADPLNDLASNLVLEDPTRATAYLDRAAQLEQSGGEDSAAAVYTQYLRGLVLQRRGKLEAARESLSGALEMSRRLADSPDDLETAMLANALATVLIKQNKAAEARPLVEASLAAQMKSAGPDDPRTGDALHALARVELAEQRLVPARSLCERALAVARKNHPGDSTESLASELLLAEIELEQGKPDAAQTSLERLVRLPKSTGNGPSFDGARARFLLARILWSDPDSRTRARELLSEAQSDYKALGAASADDLAALERWLSVH